jgi:hypothetical protein
VFFFILPNELGRQIKLLQLVQFPRMAEMDFLASFLIPEINNLSAEACMEILRMVKMRFHKKSEKAFGLEQLVDFPLVVCEDGTKSYCK